MNLLVIDLSDGQRAEVGLAGRAVQIEKDGQVFTITEKLEEVGEGVFVLAVNALLDVHSLSPNLIQLLTRPLEAQHGNHRDSLDLVRDLRGDDMGGE